MTEVKEVKEKEELSFCIVNGPPEMDLYFALARGTWVSFKLSFSDTAAERDIYINGIKFEKSYWEYRLQMTIKGAFRGNGIDSWSNFAYERDAQKGEEKNIVLWNDCLISYNKRTRKGWLVAKNYKLETQHLPEQCPHKSWG